MPRFAAHEQAMRDAARKFEGRIRRAFPRAVEKMRRSVSINDLALALSDGDRERAARMLTRASVDDALSPLGTIARDAVLKGGRVGAEQIRKAGRE
jgi:hypothetical protein